MDKLLHSLFSPFVAEWFSTVHGTPTEAQAAAWPLIAKGDNVFVTAPTGNGKTLAAFLWTLDQLLTRQWPTGQLAVIYISPLKALNNDISENLHFPLSGIRELAARQGAVLPEIHVGVRSGDSTSAERQRMMKQPSEILVTTPESLFIMLQSKYAASLFGTVRTVIVDEIHALFGNRRGVQLAASLEWLAQYAGEFQRIALSATVKPVQMAAAFAAGASAAFNPPRPRDIRIVQCQDRKQLALRLQLLPPAEANAKDDNTWKRTAEIVRPRLLQNHSTLIFCQARNTCEKVALNLNAGQQELVAFSHHGSLSKSIRQSIEKRMKSGALKAIVATSSLELGIDIGTIDEVILVNAPQSIASATQRIGRAGHRVNATSHALLLATHPHDLIQLLAIRDAILERDLEPAAPPQNCLDVLAQIILAVASARPWQLEELYNFVRSVWSYKTLPRGSFDHVIQMLCGKYDNLNITELRPRLNLDEASGICQTRAGQSLNLKLSSGTIPDRGLYKIRLSTDGSLVGELDEEFVWEARIGEHFALGSQGWIIDRITHDDVFVTHIKNCPSVPFWKAEPNDRRFQLSQRIGALLEKWDALPSDQLLATLIQDEKLQADDAASLQQHLLRQRTATGVIPHTRHLLVEHVAPVTQDKDERHQTVIHTFWGGRLNRPFAIALKSLLLADAQWQDLDMVVTDDGIWMTAALPIPKSLVFSSITADIIESLVIAGLQDSAFFAAQFREAAGRALLLPKPPPQKRKPFWMTRMNAQKLWDQTAAFPDFPIAHEAWRACLQDEFDLPHLKSMLADIQAGAIPVEEITVATASPFAQQAQWTQVNNFMYSNYTNHKASSLPPDRQYPAELLGTHELKGILTQETCTAYELKRQRLVPEYLPSSVPEVMEYLHDRWFITMDAWNCLAELLAQAPEQPDFVKNVRSQLHPLTSNTSLTLLTDQANAAEILSFPLEDIPRLASRLENLLQYLGPIHRQTFIAQLPFPATACEKALEHLLQTGKLVQGQFIISVPAPQLCLKDTLDKLLRMERNARRLVNFTAIPPLAYQAWLAHYQGLSNQSATSETLLRILRQLSLLPLKFDQLETQLLPARMPNYDPSWLNQLQDSNLLVLGYPDQTVRFMEPDDLQFLDHDTSSAPAPWPATSFTPESIHRANPQEDCQKLFREGFFNTEITPSAFPPLRQLNQAPRHQTAIMPLHVQPPFSHRRHALSRFSPIAFNNDRTSWQRIPWPAPPGDDLERLERDKERVRILIDRYGVLFKGLLDREAEDYHWGRLFPAMRIMELAGEIIAGHFINSVHSLQFAPPDLLDSLSQPVPQERVCWFQATDPASLCGLGTLLQEPAFPQRRDSTFLVMEGQDIVMTATQSGQEITIPTHLLGHLKPSWFAPWLTALTRRFSPKPSLEIRTVNHQPATSLIPREILLQSFLVERGQGKWILYKKS